MANRIVAHQLKIKDCFFHYIVGDKFANIDHAKSGHVGSSSFPQFPEPPNTMKMPENDLLLIIMEKDWVEIVCFILNRFGLSLQFGCDCFTYFGMIVNFESNKTFGLWYLFQFFWKKYIWNIGVWFLDLSVSKTKFNFVKFFYPQSDTRIDNAYSYISVQAFSKKYFNL